MRTTPEKRNYVAFYIFYIFFDSTSFRRPDFIVFLVILLIFKKKFSPANHSASRLADVRDVAQTACAPRAQSVRVQRDKRRRVLGSAGARRGARQARPRRVGSVRLHVSTVLFYFFVHFIRHYDNTPIL